MDRSHNRRKNNIAKLDQQREALNDSSRVCRNSYLWFILVSVYTLLVILATSDKQLLLRGDLAIPILNFAVPVTTIYVVMPPLYMIVHFYMLLQLSLLVPKITKFGDRCVKLKSRQVQKPLLLPFVFNERVLRWDNRGSMKLIVSFQVVLTLFVLPLFLTMGIQYRYLPMHNWDMTYYHMGMSLAHLLMVLYFAYSLGFLSKWVAKTKALFSTVFYSLTVIFVLVIPPLELSEHEYWQSWQKFLAEDIYQDKQYPTLISRNLVVTQENLTKINDAQKLSEILTLYDAYFDSKSKQYLKNGDGEHVDRGHVAKKRKQNRFYGIDLKNRDLRYANFSESVLININIEGAQFDHANLRETVLTLAIGGSIDGKVNSFNGADLLRAQLNGADLEKAQLNGADLKKAQLNGADLMFAFLNGADLGEAQLNGADLMFAFLNGADLEDAQLDDADLREAQLDDADLREAQLNGADLAHAQLNDAYLREAQLNDADLWGAELNDADLWGAELNDAYLLGAELNGANLWNAKLNGADLMFAFLNGADLESAELNGAYLREAQLNGADLMFAFLNGADLGEAQLNGADLKYAWLNGADLEDAQLNGAYLEGAELNDTKLNTAQLNNALTNEGLYDANGNLIPMAKIKASDWQSHAQNLINLYCPKDNRDLSKNSWKHSISKWSSFYKRKKLSAALKLLQSKLNDKSCEPLYNMPQYRKDGILSIK
jgi:uncharacterized protein YjbI with pentapeptide repeats